MRWRRVKVRVSWGQIWTDGSDEGVSGQWEMMSELRREE